MNENVFEAKEPTLIKIFSDSCGPCKQLEPIIHKALNQLEGAVSYKKVNGPENRDLIKPLNVTKVPTLLFVRDGVVKHKIEGMVSDSKIIAALKEHLGVL